VTRDRSGAVDLSGDEQRLIGLINRMRFFAPANVIATAEAVLRAIVEISLEPSVELRQLATEALTKSLDPGPPPEVQPGLQGRPGRLASNHGMKRAPSER
jgi:hypothetical protein